MNTCYRGTPTCEPLETRRLFASTLPHFDHVLIVMEENRSQQDILGSNTISSLLWPVVPPTQLTQAPYIRHLASQGASLTNMFAETHPSQPNYIALFSGSTQGVSSDAVPTKQISAPSLGGQLIAKGLTFAGFSEDLPAAGSLVDKSGEYARKHNPWSDFTDVPQATSNLPFSAFPANDFSKLPTVSFVVPNQKNDMHSGTVKAADDWLKSHINPYAQWARTHNSLLIVTWDEGRSSNKIATIFYGAHVRKGSFGYASDHYRVLRTVEQMYGLTPLGAAADNAPLRKIFRTTAMTTSSTATSAPVTTPRIADTIFSNSAIAPSLWEQLMNETFVGPLPLA